MTNEIDRLIDITISVCLGATLLNVIVLGLCVKLYTEFAKERMKGK